jgi:hypothetical protein
MIGSPYKNIACQNRYLHIINFATFLGVGVRLSPLGTTATNWPILLAPDDR